MPTLTLALAGLAGVLHIGFFYLESVAFRKPFAHRAFGITNANEVEVLVFPLLNQGFYNLFLALGTLTGVIGTGRAAGPFVSGPCKHACTLTYKIATPRTDLVWKGARGNAYESIQWRLHLIVANT